MSTGDGQKPPGRSLKQRVKSASGRRISSARWLERQPNDPYVSGARAEGWRSRAAYKLIQLDAKHHLLKPGGRVLDLGAAPGGWTQVALEAVQPARSGGKVVAANTINLGREMRSIERVVAARAELSPDQLADPSVNLRKLLRG